MRHLGSDHAKTSIYSGKYKGEVVCVVQQVNDFALACANESTAIAICRDIGKALQLPKEKINLRSFTYLGLMDDFNGIDVEQSHEYIFKSLVETILTKL